MGTIVVIERGVGMDRTVGMGMFCTHFCVIVICIITGVDVIVSSLSQPAPSDFVPFAHFSPAII